MLIGQLICIVSPWKEEKSNTYTYYKRAKDLSTSGGHYHRIIFFHFFLKQTQTKKIICFVSFKYLHQILSPLIYFSILEKMVFLTLIIQFLLLILIPLKAILMVSLILFRTNNQYSCYQWITHRFPCTPTWKQTNRKVLSSNTV